MKRRCTRCSKVLISRDIGGILTFDAFPVFYYVAKASKVFDKWGITGVIRHAVVVHHVITDVYL